MQPPLSSISTCAKQGGKNKTGREYADNSPNTNEDGHLIGTTKSGYKQQRGRQNTRTSVNLGGMDETAREYANNSSSTNEDGHDEGSWNRLINKGLQDEEEDQGTDDDNEDWEGYD